MQHWKQLIAVAVLAIPPALTAQADVFHVTDGLAGSDTQVRTYTFDITAPAEYLASLIDLNYPATFKTLSLGVSKSGGDTILGATSVPGTFSFIADTSGPYSLLLVGEPDPSSKAGFYSLVVDIRPVPEPAMWLMMGTGALLLGWIKLRRKENFG